MPYRERETQESETLTDGYVGAEYKQVLLVGLNFFRKNVSLGQVSATALGQGPSYLTFCCLEPTKQMLECSWVLNFMIKGLWAYEHVVRLALQPNIFDFPIASGTTQCHTKV